MKQLVNAKESEEWEGDPFFASEEHTEDISPQKPKNREHWLTVLQITVCAVILLAALCMKFFGGEWYTVFRNWYIEHVNQSILTDADLQIMEQKVLELFPTAPESAGENSSNGDNTEASSQASSGVSSLPAASSESQGAKTAASSGG